MLNALNVNVNVIAKLPAFNFAPLTLKWIESKLNVRSQHVSVNNHRSPSLNQCTGVPQGSILGLLLVSLYINDLPLVCLEINTLMCPNNTAICVHASTKHLAAAKLTTAMDQITMTMIKSLTVHIIASFKKKNIHKLLSWEDIIKCKKHLPRLQNSA